jgi:hypothetical protein
VFLVVSVVASTKLYYHFFHINNTDNLNKILEIL